MTKAPSYYDREAGVECYVDGVHIRVIADQRDLNVEQAKQFADALLACARFVRENP